LNLPRALVIADSAEPKSNDEIQSYGINIVGAAKGKDSVNHRIQLVQEERVSVTRRSANIIPFADAFQITCDERRHWLWRV
jgi:phage terminase large subunit